MPDVAPPTVLTAEDNPLVRADLRLMLEGAGFSVCADARDGVEAVELAREHRPYLILIDLRLPRLDGVDATRLIRGERDVPVVALTGYRGFAEQAIAAGATSYVLKPFSEDEIVDAVAGALRTHAEGVVRARREESRAVLEDIVRALGYPPEWSHELERHCYRSGRLWRQA